MKCPQCGVTHSSGTYCMFCETKLVGEPQPPDSPLDGMVGLPTYESNASAQERQQKLEFIAEQIKLIRAQEKDGIPITRINIRCGCHKLIGWMYMYRCLYCGVWYCAECAEFHFGMKRAEPFA